MTLHDKIATLPEWPVWKGKPETWTFPDNFAEADPTCYAIVALGAAQARLALAREWIAANDRPCSREEILAALEVPK